MCVLRPAGRKTRHRRRPGGSGCRMCHERQDDGGAWEMSTPAAYASPENSPVLSTVMRWQ